MIEVGSFVRYTASDDEPPVPALVQTIWEDGSGYELYVFHFTSQSHIRSAHPSQVEEVGGNSNLKSIIDELNEDLAALAARVTDLEEDNQMLRAELVHLGGGKKAEPVQVDASELPEEGSAPVVDAGVDAGVESTQTEDEDQELAGVGAKSKGSRRRSAWPNQ